MTTETVTGNVCRLHDTESNVTNLNGGSVIQFRPRKLQQSPSQDKVFDHFDRWARFTGHGKEGEVVVVMN